MRWNRLYRVLGYYFIIYPSRSASILGQDFVSTMQKSSTLDERESYTLHQLGLEELFPEQSHQGSFYRNQNEHVKCEHTP